MPTDRKRTPVSGEEIHHALRSVLEPKEEVRYAVLYGSAAAGRLRGDSDLDIAVAGERPFSVDERLEMAGELSERTGREIDLVDLHSAPPLLLHQILTKGREFINRDHYLKAGFMQKVVYFAEDFLPQVTGALDSRVKRWVCG